MVFLAVKFNFLLASCCRLEVVKGGAERRLRSFLVASLIMKLAFKSASSAALASSAFLISNFLPLYLTASASKIGDLLFSRSLAFKVQYSWGIKSAISFSLSAIILTATDCTRPALKPLRILRHRSGLSL